MDEHHDPIWSGERQAAQTAVADYEAVLDEYLGRGAARTVELLGLRPGERVLDVACGTGAATLAAAERVGPGGRVTGLDLSPEMLAMAADKARGRGIGNASWVAGDMARLDYPDGHFDAVLSVLSLFFAPDMAAQAAELWRVVRPGGRLAITTLGRKLFAPLHVVFEDAVEEIAPGTPQNYAPNRTNDPAVIGQLLAAAGIPGARITQEVYTLPLRSPDDWWRIVLGTGIRRTVMQMEPEAAARVRAHNRAWIVSNDVRAVELGFIYALAEKS